MRDYLKKTEFWSAMILLLLHMVLFPMALSVLLSMYPQLLTETQANLAYYAVTTTLVFILLGRYLRRSFDALIDNIFGCLRSFGLGIIMYFVLNTAAGLVMGALGLSGDNLNQEAISGMFAENRGMIVAMTVFLAPVAEETLFRGGLFCGLYRRGRWLAYGVCVFAFCIYHVWQYALAMWDISYLLMAIQYIPAAFTLCWIYEQSGSVWTSIFFHMGVNLLGVVMI